MNREHIKILVDVIPYGSIPCFDYEKGTEITTFDENGTLVNFILAKQRFWGIFRYTVNESDDIFLSMLQKAMPDADELRVLSEGTQSYARKCYFAIKYPIVEDDSMEDPLFSLGRQLTRFHHQESDRSHPYHLLNYQRWRIPRPWDGPELQ